MCFVINRRAQRPANTYVWKVVEVHHHDREIASGLGSPFYKSPNGSWNEPGGVRQMRKPTIRPDQTYSAQGFYVYLSEAAAVRACGSYALRNLPKAWRVPLKLHVRPEDFIARGSTYYGGAASTATYCRVEICEDQPYIEWC